MTKQYYQFGTFSTSTFTGLNLERSVGMNTMKKYRDYLEFINYNEDRASTLPQTLTRKHKLTGTPNFNNIEYLQLNQQFEDDFKAYVFSTSPLQLLNSYRDNIQKYFSPSSRYTKHVIVDRLPWRDGYDKLFSAPILYIIIFLFGILWLLKRIKLRDYLSSAGMLMPGIFIFVICILFEKGENARFKFFLEPVLFIFIISQLHFLFRKMQALLAHRYSASLLLAKASARLAGFTFRLPSPNPPQRRNEFKPLTGSSARHSNRR